MAKPQALDADDMVPAKPSPASTSRQRGEVPSAELVPMNFKLPPDFVREFKRAALDREMKLNELFIYSFKYFVKNDKG